MTALPLHAETNSEKRIRNRRNAHRTHDAVLDLSENLNLTGSERKQLSEKFGELKLALQKIGESF